MLALSVTLVDRQALAALAVSVTGALGMSDVAYGLLSSAFAGAYLVGALAAGQLMQSVGPRWGLSATVALASLAIGLHATAGSFAEVLVLRIVLGLVVAPAFACAAQTVHFVLPFKDRARVSACYRKPLGSALPLAALGSFFGWRAAFVWVCRRSGVGAALDATLSRVKLGPRSIVRRDRSSVCRSRNHPEGGSHRTSWMF
jgi:predicted MFS family arabinose efflux permease